MGVCRRNHQGPTNRCRVICWKPFSNCKCQSINSRLNTLEIIEGDKHELALLNLKSNSTFPICIEDKCVFVLKTSVYLSWGQMRICLEDKCVFVLRTNVYSHCFSQIPLFVGVLPRFGEWPWQMGSSQPLSLQCVLSPKQRKLRHIKAGCFREISELANYMMVGTVGTGQSVLVLESSFLAPNPVYK